MTTNNGEQKDLEKLAKRIGIAQIDLKELIERINAMGWNCSLLHPPTCIFCNRSVEGTRPLIGVWFPPEGNRAYISCARHVEGIT